MDCRVIGCPTMRILIAAISLAAFLLPAHSTASGQSVLVEVTAAETGSPLRGVFVSILDDVGQVVRSALTNEAGRFLFQLSQAGNFQVKAELIGRETVVSDTVVLRHQGSVTVPLTLSVHAIALAAIRVEGDERCRIRPDEASEITRVWEESRKPLAVQAWSEREGLYRLDISTYDRDLDREGRRVERENRRGTSRVTRVPFASLPAEDLLRGGFVRSLDDGGHEYYGPDATLLLSNHFLDTHCFRLTRSGDRQGAIGLAFEPARASELADIQGTLWVDEATAALRLVEFRFTRAPYAEAEGVAGGRVEFEALPDGAWMIRKWWIRAPIMARHQNLARAGDSGIRVAGIRETGGEVVAVSTLDQRRITQVLRGSLRGIIWDSAASAPLAGASVYLAGTQFRAETDSTGRYVLDGLPAGVFKVGFTHPRLDSLGIDVSGTEAEVTTGQTAEVVLAIPSMATILLAACRAEERNSGGAVLSGTVTDQASGEPVPGARVRVAWLEVNRVEPMLQATDRWFEVGTDTKGRYIACGIPVDKSIQIRASLLKSEGTVTEVSFAEETYQTANLVIELPAVLSAGAAETSTLAGESGAHGLQGVLVEHESGNRIRAATVTVRHTSGEVVAAGVTNERGFFRLQTPTPGRFFLTADALGYRRIEGELIEVSEGKLSVLEINMAPEALELESIVVTAEPMEFHLEVEGFYRRQAEGLGKFMPPALFEERQPRKVSDLLFGLPGAYVAESTTGIGGRAVYFRSGIRASSFSGGTLRPSDVCWPMIFVDRQLVSTGGGVEGGAEPAGLDGVVHAADVWAMEVYRSPGEVPSEFKGSNAGCGVIVLWTRRGGGG